MKLEDYGDWTEICPAHPRSMTRGENLWIKVKGHLPKKEIEKLYPNYYDFVHYTHGQIIHPEITP